MFLDGTGDQLSGLQEKDNAGGGDHAEGDPLDGVEDAFVGIGLPDEGEEELNGAGGGEGKDESVARAMAVVELANEKYGEEGCRNRGVKGDGVEWDAAGRNGQSPGQSGGESGVTAFGEVAQREKDPREGGTGGPGVEGVEEREMTEAEIDRRCDDGEDHASGGERG